jgi:hypothetical protein
MKTSLVNAVLAMFVMAYFYAAWIFMMQQKHCIPFIASFDKSIVRGGCFFVLGSGLSFITIVYGNFQQVFI